MKKNDQIRALIDAFIDLSETWYGNEQGMMESLLDIFDPKELIDLGYEARVKAYFDEYGSGDELEEPVR